MQNKPRPRFAMDLLAIIEEAINDTWLGKKSFGDICDFWEEEGALCVGLPEVSAELLYRMKRPDYPKKVISFKLMRNLVQANINSSKLPALNKGSYIHLEQIESCTEMADHQAKFALAVLSDEQASKFVSNITSKKFCKHCEAVEVISWRFFSESCVVKEARATTEETRNREREALRRVQAYDEIADSIIEQVPLDYSSEELWNRFFAKLAQTTSAISLVDGYVGLRKDLRGSTEPSTEAIEQVLCFLNREFAINRNLEKSVTIYTICDSDKFEGYKNILERVVGNLKHINNVTVYVFNSRDRAVNEKRFPRERWLGFDDKRLSFHGIDFLSKAREGERVITHSRASAENLRGIEAKLRDAELGVPLDDYIL